MPEESATRLGWSRLYGNKPQHANQPALIRPATSMRQDEAVASVKHHWYLLTELRFCPLSAPAKVPLKKFRSGYGPGLYADTTVIYCLNTLQ